MTIKRKITIEIDTEFGSDFQEEVSITSLVVLLKAWKMNVNMTHKKNKVTFRTAGAELLGRTN